PLDAELPERREVLGGQLGAERAGDVAVAVGPEGQAIPQRRHQDHFFSTSKSLDIPHALACVVQVQIEEAAVVEPGAEDLAAVDVSNAAAAVARVDGEHMQLLKCSWPLSR